VISSAELCALIEPVAQHLLGDPNRSLSSKTEWRYGSRGSFCIDLRKGTFFDHETSKGGGVLDLIEREKGLKGPDRLQWLIDERLVHKPNGAAHKANGADHGGLGRIVATYDYIDENGVLLFQAVRYEPKDFRQRRPDLDHPGKWNWSIKGVRQVPYRLTELLEPLSLGRVVFIVEGEKDVNRLWSIGIPATCNAMGAGKWPEELNAIFAGADVVIIPDNDPQKRHPKTDAPMFHDDGRPILPGQDHAETVAAALIAVAAKVRVLDLAKVWPEMPLKGDVSDWLDRGGGSADGFYKLIEGLPIWEPAAKRPNGDARSEHTFDERSPPPPGEDAEAAEPAKPLFTVADAMDFPDDPPDREWLVPGIIPAHEITMVMGDGGTGKSLIALQLAFAAATGTEWIGTMPTEGRVLYFSAEDELGEMHRRHACIARRQGAKVAERGRLEIIPRAGEDAVLATSKPGGAGLAPTKLYEELAAKIDKTRPDLLIRQFIGMLRRFALRFGTTVLLLNHPSLSGMASGSGTSGSTAWNNSVRSRLYLTYPPGTKDDDEDIDTRILTAKKANYGRTGEKRVVRWDRGVFVLESAASPGKMEAEAKDNQAFLDMLDEFERQKRPVSASPSTTYAPALFADHPDGNALSKERYRGAMERLLKASRIHTDTSGPPSKQRQHIKRGPP
jgi:RecA-family ATPase